MRTSTSLGFGQIVFVGIAILCFTPLFNPPIALFIGILVAQLIQHPFPQHNQKITSFLLQFSIVGLGFGMNLNTALAAGKQGFSLTVASIFGTLFLGVLLGKLFKSDRISSFLISAGTAICGGSAIAALSPVVKANEKQISVALGVVFILNSAALFIFPAVGSMLHLTQNQFGLWCAIAIHDTSSVVGAAAKYGTEALQVATTVKLTRALWIIPLTFTCSFLFKNEEKKVKIPSFIGLFILAIAINTYFPFVQKWSPNIVFLATKGLTLTLFLIGSNLSWKKMKSIGPIPIFQGVILWLSISITALIFIKNFL